MKTVCLLMALYGGLPIIPLDKVCRDLCADRQAARRAPEGAKRWTSARAIRIVARAG